MRAMADVAPLAVLHFAASAYVDESVRDPAAYYRNNVGGTINLLDAMRRHGVDTIVFSSTCATYGVPHRLPIDECHPQQPISPYGHTKLVVERILAAYAEAYGLRWSALRYFNAAGADPAGDLGEEHDPETHLVPSALLAAMGRRPPLPVYGSDYPTPDGTAVRDYVHVSDLASAHVAALRHLLDGGPSTALNLGTGAGHSVREVIGAVERVTGLTVPVAARARRAGDPAALVADASRARSLLAWAPVHSGLDDIVASAWQWFQSNGAGLPDTAAVATSSLAVGSYAGEGS